MTVPRQIREAPLISASRMLAERGFYGIVWVTPDLQVAARYGELVDFVELGEPITDSVLPLMGLEPDIRSLRRKPQSVLDIPSVTIIDGVRRTPRLNVAMIWCPADACYLVLASRAVLRTDLEVELNRQIRARLIAEAAVDAKSVELQRANRELEKTNADLEQFASVISHDLKSPMRALRYLAEDAQAELERGDIAAGLAKVEAIRTQTLRMSYMLSALLDYASTARKSDVLEVVDTRRLVEAIAAALPPRPGFRVDIEGDWPQLTTFAAMLDLVLRNLIDNALVHHDRDSGTAVVTAKPRDNDVVFSVEDDGPGIPMREQSAIFLPFRSISRGKIPTEGTGMGLALVVRALGAVGGSLSVMSNAPDVRGTTFTVVWPKVLPHGMCKPVDILSEAG